MTTEIQPKSIIVEILKSKYGFDLTEIAIEPHIQYGSEIIIPDILVIQRKNSNEIPVVVVEIKRTVHPLHQERLFESMNKLKAPYGILTNGSQFLFFRQITLNRFVQIPNIPFRGEGESHFDVQSLNEDWSVSTTLDKVAWFISESLRRSGLKHSPIEIILVLQKILMCKFVDETVRNNPPLFSIFPVFNKESKIMGDVSDRMRILFRKVKVIYPDIFDSNEELPLDDESIVKILSELQSESITRIKRKKFIKEYLMFTEGFFHFEKFSFKPLPKWIYSFITSLLDPSKSEKILDLTVQFSLFLLSCVLYIEENLENDTIQKSSEHSPRKTHNHIYGIEENAQLYSIAKSMAILSGLNSDHIIHGNALLSSNYLETDFDVIFGIPPIGSIQKVDSPHYRSKNVLYQGKNDDFALVELGLSLLSPKGRIAMIISDKFLRSKSTIRLRRFLLENKLISAIVSLRPSTLFRYVKPKVSIIILDKSRLQGDLKNYKIFMAEIGDWRETLTKYRAFRSGIESKHSDKIFSINSSDLKIGNWVVSRYVPLLWTKEGIKLVNLGDLVEITNGIRIAKSSLIDDTLSNGVFYLRPSDIVYNTIDLGKIRHIDAREMKDIEKNRVREKDIVFSLTGSVGRAAIISSDLNDSIFSNNLAAFRVSTELLTPEYLFHIIRSEFVQEQIHRLTIRFIGGEKLVSRDLKKIQIPLLPLEQQIKFVSEIDKLERKYNSEFNYSRYDMPKLIDDIFMEVTKK